MKHRTLSILTLIALTITAPAAVTVYFEQVDSDVKISWSGTLNVTIQSENYQSRHTDEFGPEGFLDSDSNNYATPGPFHFALSVGDTPFFGPLDLDFFDEWYPEPIAETEGTWGFLLGSFIWSEEIISEGTTLSPTQFTLNPAKQTMLIRNETLSNLKANNLENDLAWTANGTGDTISYQTGAAPIPEPTSTALIALAPLIIILRRKR